MFTFTSAQTESIEQLLDMLASLGDQVGEVQPVRYAVIPDDMLAEIPSDQRDKFGDGVVAIVGALDPDMSDCECGELHVRYTSVRANGDSAPPVTSGTFEETLLGPPTELMWENALPIEPEMFTT